MADIDLRRRHTLGKSGARTAVERVARDLQRQLDFAHRWEGDVLRFERSGAEGRIEVGEEEVRTVIALGLLLKPMKGQVRREAERLLERHLA